MRAVHVRVGHDDDLGVAELGDVEIVLADAGAERGDEGADFFVAEHLVDARFFDVQDFAAQRQNRLVAAVAALLGRAAGGIALDQEQLAARRIFFLAIGQLAGQAARIERALAPRQLAGLARRFAGARGVNRLGANLAAHGGILLEMLHQLLVHEARHRGLDIAVQLAFRLPFKLRLRQLDADDPHQAFAHVLTLKVFLHVLEQGLVLPELVDGARQCGAEAGEVCAAIHCIDIICKAKYRLGITVVVLDGEFHGDFVALRLAINGRRVEDILVLVEVLHKLGDPARVMEFRLLVRAFVRELDGDAFIKERQFAQALRQGVVVELDGIENL